MIKTFFEILAWQKAHTLTLQVYKLSEVFPKKETFGLMIQLRRAAVSIASNIAEGFKRKGHKDSLHFYNIAQGSLEEVKYQLFLAKDLHYITPQAYAEIADLADETGRILDGWIKSQR